MILYYIFIVILYFSFYNYLYRLKEKNCNCAIKKDYKFIKNFTLFYIIFLLIIPIFSVLLYVLGLKYLLKVSLFLVKYNKIIKIFTSLIAIFYLYNVYKYIQILNGIDCECSESNTRTLMYFYSIIVLISSVLLELVLISSILLKNKKLDNLSHFLLKGNKKKHLSNKNKKILLNTLEK